ncbi:MAG: hypothetical protein HY913_18955 [Desulfomonile tiedjei]|nr:hypothetical protein [Desulfomonile tiedjei]
MTEPVTTVEHWTELNAGNLVDCRWGCRITVDACHSYQSRAARYVLHFNGDRTPSQRVNAEYLRCVFPEPCTNFLSDEEAQAARELRALTKRPLQMQIRQHQGREMNRLINPEEMLREAPWHRSLVTA